MSFLGVPSGADEKKSEDSGDGTMWSRATGSREESIEEMYSSPRFGDLTLRCIDEKSGAVLKDFLVNRAFLASASDVWRASFYGKFTEAKKGAVVEMRGVDPAILECLVRFAYFIDPKVDRYNAMPVRLLAERYQVNGLRRFCDELLSEKSLTPESVCEMLAAAMQYDLKSLVVTCVSTMEEKFKSKDFETMFASKGFLSMPSGALCHLLRSDRLKVKEEKLWEYLEHWASSMEAKKAKELLKAATEATLAAKAAIEAGEEPPKKADDADGEEKKADESTEEKKEEDSLMGSSLTKAAVDPTTALEFLQIVKPLVRFPVMDMKYLLTAVSKSKILSLEEEHLIMKSVVLGNKLSPFNMEKRKGVASFEDSIHFTRGTHGSGWGYGGSRDALVLTWSEDVMLIGVGIWNCDAGCRSTIRIYDGNNGSGNTPVITYPEQTFPAGKNTTPLPYIFPEPFEMEGGRRYTVELHQINNSGSSYSTTSTRTTITEEGITLTLSAASSSPNSTSTSGGALPCFYACN